MRLLGKQPFQVSERATTGPPRCGGRRSEGALPFDGCSPVEIKVRQRLVRWKTIVMHRGAERPGHASSSMCTFQQTPAHKGN